MHSDLERPKGECFFSLTFFILHASSIARGVGHPPSHRLKSFPLTFFRGGAAPHAIFVKRKGTFFPLSMLPVIPSTALSLLVFLALLRESL